MENQNEVADLVQEFPQLEELLTGDRVESGEVGKTPQSQDLRETPCASSPFRGAKGVGGDLREEEQTAEPKLQKELESALQRVQQLEHERWLLSQGVPEEDLDYYAFKIGKLVTSEKDFAAAAKDYLKSHRSAPRISTAAALAGRVTKTPTSNDLMNQLIRNHE